MLTQIYESGHFSSAEELGKRIGISGKIIGYIINCRIILYKGIP